MDRQSLRDWVHRFDADVLRDKPRSGRPPRSNADQSQAFDAIVEAGPDLETDGAARISEISKAVAPGAPAALVLDGAGRHVSVKLIAPDNISLVGLQPYAPELVPSKTCGPIFLARSWPTACSTATKTSSMLAAMP